VLQSEEVIAHATGNQHPERHEKLALLAEVGLARLPNDIRYIGHPLVHWQRLGLLVLHQAKCRSQQADEQAQVEDGHARNAAEVNLAQRRNLDIRFSSEQAGSAEEENNEGTRSNP
jgi:hypothetical protein